MTLVLANTETKEKVIKEFDIKKDDLETGIKTLKEWIQTQPHLPDCLNDKELEAVLVMNKNSIERTKKSIDTYWSARNRCPEFYTDRDPCLPEIRQSEEAVKYFPLPELTPEGYRVDVFYVSDLDSKHFDVKSTMKRVLAIADIRRKEETYCSGDYIIYDCQHFTISHLSKFTPTLASKALFCTQEAVSTRMKGIFLINSNKYVESVVNIFKPLMKEKIANRIHIFSGDHTELYKFIPQDILPNEYGGKAGSRDELSKAWLKRIESEREWLIKEGSMAADESKRPADSLVKDSAMFGVVGNFKKLSFD
ncbi:alpha-tocopherol transfer protein-like [Nilaparvata lugens]|uniref:alpha-tocopherol transfer protein-like n=1 Tax=Nilaparvata lugens TaxID=108931 RepID=UPI00193E1E81|nr:alpha-tocopherol transfer protein-like [Nilaparvata lugens]